MTDDRRQPGEPIERDLELDAAESHSLEMLGRVYSQAIQRHQISTAVPEVAESSEQDAPAAEADEAVEPGVDPLEDDTCPVTPRSILEAMLFVGQKEGGITARRAASLMRGVSPHEVERLVDDLNESYAADCSPIRVRLDADGYRMVIEPDLESIRELFFRRIREARLGGAAIEALAIVAYHQPVTMDEVDRLRNRQSGPVLNLLVRRELLAVERDKENRRVRRYRTTERFLELFGIESIEDLPQAHSPQGADFLDE